MFEAFNAADHCWRRGQPGAWGADIYASGLGRLLTAADPQPANWTTWPADDTGQQTDAALDAVLHGLGLPGPGGEPVPASVSSAQAKIQLRRTPGSAKDRTLRDDVDDAVKAADGETQDWYAEARTWERTNPRVAAIGGTLKLKPTDIDALFIAAAKIAA